MINIAIDGPSGAGKSTLAKRIAAELGYVYVDTGALYRAIGLYVYEQGVDPADADAVAGLLEDISIELTYENGTQNVILNKRNVNSEIRLPQISMYASTVSKIPRVREFLLDLQRNMAKNNNVIMDGRDIGTVILPDADVKIFLTASARGRAKRRYRELVEKGVATTYNAVLKDIVARDKQDSGREIAPAVAAKDAVVLDNTNLDFEATVQEALKIINDRISGENQ